MGYYLLDHKPASPQYRRPRRQPLSGAIGWHTTEGALDRIAPDTGAENVAAYISRRTDPGSYHAIHDSDSTVLMLPDDAEAFHVAADGINRFTVGQAAAMRTTDWHPSDPQSVDILHRMAIWAVGFWSRNGVDPRACAKWLTRAEVLDRQPGMFLHGTVQSDRSDAWLRSPHRLTLEAMTVQAILDLCPLPTPEDPMTTHVKLHPDVAKPSANDGGGRDWPAGEAVADSGRLIPVLGEAVLKVVPPERVVDLSADKGGSFAVIDAFRNATR